MKLRTFIDMLKTPEDAAQFTAEQIMEMEVVIEDWRGVDHTPQSVFLSVEDDEATIVVDVGVKD